MNYYTLNFILVQDYKMSLSEIENLIPYERDIYVNMLTNRLEEQRKQQEQESKAEQLGRWNSEPKRHEFERE